jgi:hypothetical protein
MKKLQYPNIFTFQPKIGNASIILQYSPLQEGNRETTCEKLERLSYQDNVRRHHIRQRISVRCLMQVVRCYNFKLHTSKTKIK